MKAIGNKAAVTITGPIVGFLLASTLSGIEAAKERISVVDGDFKFNVDRYDDNRSKPYGLVFRDNGAKSMYKFNTAGFVTNVSVGMEKYKVKYKSNGDLKWVKLTSSRRGRSLQADEQEEDYLLGGADKNVLEELHQGTRRLLACDDCEEAWDVVCDEGVTSVCELVGYGSPLLPAAEASIQIVCEIFKNTCARSEGEDVCSGQCEDGTHDDIDPCSGVVCGIDAVCSNNGDCVCPPGHAGDPLTSCTTSVNPCLNATSDGYLCSPTGATSLRIRCDLTDADSPFLAPCFEDFGKTNIESLDLLGNNLTYVPEGLFSGLTELETLNFGFNNLTSLPAGVFSDNEQLKLLLIGRNKLTSLPEGIFSNTPNLAKVSFSDNKLSVLSEGLFSSTPILWNVGLSNNKLVSLPEGIFSGHSELYSVTLGGNELASLPAGIFKDLPSLSSQVTLDSNSLTSLPEGLFADLTDLNILDLSNNDGLQCLPTTFATDLRLPSDSVVNGTCECEPAVAITCGHGLSCQPGSAGYTCV